MGLSLGDLTGVGAAIDGISSIVDHFVPNKTEEQKAQITAMLTAVQAQTDIDKAEAQSSDPLQHWRGGLGWVCVLAYLWNFVVAPLTVMISTAVGHPFVVAPLDSTPLFELTGGMLGLGGLHVYERVKGAA
jgi:hypothetical protein